MRTVFFALCAVLLMLASLPCFAVRSLAYEPYCKGDINGDGKINSFDYYRIMLHSVSRRLLTGEALAAADVNDDGLVDSCDYTTVRLHTKEQLLLHPDDGKELTVLFLGNSFTFYNDMYREFVRAGESCGYKVTAYQVAYGGRRFYEYCDETGTYGKEFYSAINARKYDYVFIQEQSTAPLDYYENFRVSGTELIGIIKSKGAVPVLYSTWGYPSEATARGMSIAEMENALTEAYASLGKATGVKVSFAGKAMTEAYQNGADIYSSDSKHPGEHGSYMIALLHFAAVSGISPENILYIPSSITADEAAILRTAATHAFESMQ